MKERLKCLFVLIALSNVASLPGCAGLGLRGAYEPDSAYDVRVWKNFTSSNFIFPELADDDFGMPGLQGKPSIGICLGGGGFRANIMSLGWIRALHKVGFSRRRAAMGALETHCPTFFMVQSVQSSLNQRPALAAVAAHADTYFNACTHETAAQATVKVIHMHTGALEHDTA